MPAQPIVCLLSLLCACSGCYVPAQAAMCLLRLLCACCVPAQAVVCLLSLLCACSGYCVHAQPVVCHNTTEPAVCLLSLLRATIQPAVLLLNFRKWAIAHSSSNNLFFFFSFLFSNPPVASLPLLKCSSLDHCNSYNYFFFFKSFILTLFLCKNWKNFPEFHKTDKLMLKTGATVQNFQDHSAQKFLNTYSYTKP